jgi:hypothetical protein
MYIKFFVVFIHKIVLCLQILTFAFHRETTAGKGEMNIFFHLHYGALHEYLDITNPVLTSQSVLLI